MPTSITSLKVCVFIRYSLIFVSDLWNGHPFPNIILRDLKDDRRTVIDISPRYSEASQLIPLPDPFLLTSDRCSSRSNFFCQVRNVTSLLSHNEIQCPLSPQL